METNPMKKRRPEKMMELMLRSPSSSKECVERVASMATWPKTVAKEMMEETTMDVDTPSVEDSKEEEIGSTRAMVEEDIAEETISMIEIDLEMETDESKASATIVASQDTWPWIADPNPRMMIEETKLMKEK
jgi:hypothetical protein